MKLKLCFQINLSSHSGGKKWSSGPTARQEKFHVLQLWKKKIHLVANSPRRQFLTSCYSKYLTFFAWDLNKFSGTVILANPWKIYNGQQIQCQGIFFRQVIQLWALTKIVDHSTENCLQICHVNGNMRFCFYWLKMVRPFFWHRRGSTQDTPLAILDNTLTYPESTMCSLARDDDTNVTNHRAGETTCDGLWVTCRLLEWLPWGWLWCHNETSHE